MIRSKWKGVYCNKVIFRSTDYVSENLISTKMQEKNVKHFIWQKNSTIPIFFNNKRVCVYNGKRYHSFLINSNMLNFKFGEFVITKKLGRIHKELIK